MYIKRFLFSALLINALFYTSACFGQCSAKIQRIEHLFDNLQDYRTLQNQDAEKQIKVIIEGDTSCSYYLQVSSENNQQLRGQYQHIPYFIGNSSSIFNNSSVNNLAISDNTTDLRFVIAKGSIARAGQYQDTVKLVLKSQFHEVVDELDYDLDVSIPTHVALSFLGYNSANTSIDLGELIPQKEYSLLPSLQVVANTDITMTIWSEHNGKLIHELYQSSYAINYSLALTGDYVELNHAMKRRFLFTKQTDFLIPLKIKLTAFSNQAAGQYQDTIRFQVSPQAY
ncbi:MULTISPECIES: hypothetical protein [unclassified Pseudoalteromonas]|uniref:hypothetical protein n=1 Tax=unclassified Pseudoalteromonas TaxID=194690 RepID=UPI000CF680D4|nr:MULTISPECIES: hypothetical protein [unclassified Pseudoalteromonas]TMO30723.1 hypothetical protein CWC28_02515 [Pseudoalteromonas sp. S4492]